MEHIEEQDLTAENDDLMSLVEEMEQDSEEVGEPIIESRSQSGLQELQSRIDELQARNEQLMRVAADFENFKRRQEREREDLTKYAGQQVITNLLSVIDNFDRALQAEPSVENFENFVQGVRMIHSQFLDVLSKSGVAVINAVGEPFNPEYHEAIMSEENDEVPDETVIGEFQKGYVMHGRLIRPSIVKVSKAS